MDSFIHADIFFFVTTVALVLVTLGMLVALIFVIKILRDISQMSSKIKHETHEIIHDVQELRGNIRREGFKIRYASGFLTSLFGKFKRKRSRENTRERASRSADDGDAGGNK